MSQVRIFILTHFSGVAYFTYLFRSLEFQVCQKMIKEELIVVKCGSWTLDQVLVLVVQIQQKIRLHEGIVDTMKKKVTKAMKKQNQYYNHIPLLKMISGVRPNGQSLDEVLGISTFHRIVKGYIH